MPHLPTLSSALGTRRGRRVPFFAPGLRLPTQALNLVSLGLLAGCLLVGRAHAQSADQVKADFARAVYVHSATQVHNQRPQPLLRAVVVLRIKLDEQNRWQAEVFRDNPDQPEMTRAALESVARLPAPTGLSSKAVDMLRSEGLVEAWLFENDGRFALKTLAKPQRGA
jgi:protein TonB